MMEAKKMIYENHRDSQHQIRLIETSLSDLQSLVDHYTGLFGTAPTMEDLQTLFREPGLTRQRYFEAITKEMPTAIQKAVVSANEPEIAGLLAKANELEAVSHHLRFLTMTKDRLSFTDQGREALKEDFRIYITSEPGQQLFKLQQSYVKTLNELLTLSREKAPQVSLIPFRLPLDLAIYDEAMKEFKPTLIDYERFITKT